MKYLSILAVTLGALVLAGCATQSGTGQRIAIDSLATGIGGASAYLGSNGDPALTTAGAVGGFVVSEAFQSMARSGRDKAYQSGIEIGRASCRERVCQYV